MIFELRRFLHFCFISEIWLKNPTCFAFIFDASSGYDKVQKRRYLYSIFLDQDLILDQEMSSVLLTPSPMNQFYPPKTFFFENLTFSKDFFSNYNEMIWRDSIFILLIWKWVLFLVRTFNWCLSTIFLGIVNKLSQWLRMNYATKMIHFWVLKNISLANWLIEYHSLWGVPLK